MRECPSPGRASGRQLLQFLQFLLVGGIATAGHYLVMLLLLAVPRVGPLLATSAGFAVGAVIGYRLNSMFTFRGGTHSTERLARYVAVALVGALLNVCLLAVVAHVVEQVWPAQILVTAIVFPCNFILNRLWTFQRERT